MRPVADLIARIARSDAAVLIQGETGTGKELVARTLHRISGAPGSFVALNCAAVPFDLLESELFGHARGAYTDARSDRRGLFVEADGGTIFLDELGDLPLEIQPKLLRALQERVVRPIGSNVELPFNARLITATNRNLEDEVRGKRFREDLFYRVNVITVALPSLRERGDILELAEHFLSLSARRVGKPQLKISTAASKRLLAYSWPGNVRELENCMEHASVLATFDEITVADLPERVHALSSKAFVDSAQRADEIVTIAELERHYILRAITLLDGNKARAAQVLGLDRKTLYRKLERLGIPLRELQGAAKTRTH